jgi:ABC-type lipoprotein export system ATPase subunit
MLRLENLSKYYYSKNNIVMALRRINLTFSPGEFIAITGESGSGKSTLLNVLSGLDTYEEGKMFVNDKDISHFSVAELEEYRRTYIGFVFQDYNIIDAYTVYQNIKIALTINGYPKEDRHKRTLELIKQVGLDNQTHQKASKLSGGEQQRTVIARALAKDAPMIVCDEPTGNLDTKSANQILKLLHDIAKDKLVIVVTHNFSQVEQYATRKIRLYDGEVIEDTHLGENTSGLSTFNEASHTHATILEITKIAFENIISVPKKSFFALTIMLFMILAITFTYGFTIEQRNQPYQTQTPYFDNAFEGRVIITKEDKSAFTDSEIASIADTKNVLSVNPYDMIFDSLFTSAVFNETYNKTIYYDYQINPSINLSPFDLLEGRLPENPYEAVINPNELYELGDYIHVSNRATIKKVEGLVTNQFTYKIVGFTDEAIGLDEKGQLYLNQEGISNLQSYTIYENSKIYLDIDQLRDYSVVNDIRVDNTLEDNELRAFDMMFFDICRDFGYKEDVIDDFDAGLCPVEEFIPFHDFSLSVITRFENQPLLYPINITSVPVEPNIMGQALYLNQHTFDELFKDEPYQITAVVDTMYEALLVKDDLEEAGYNVFYPAGVLNESDAFNVVTRNVQLSLTLVLSVLGIYLVGYFVMRNIVSSKHKDYVIYRSIGTEKSVIHKMMIFEMLIQSIFAYIIVIGLLIINESMDNQIPKLMRYFQVQHYIIIFITIIVLMIWMARNFNDRLFGQSVITSLRVE